MGIVFENGLNLSAINHCYGGHHIAIKRNKQYELKDYQLSTSKNIVYKEKKILQ